MSENIYDHTKSHGVDEKWEYVLDGLTPNTFYNLSVLSENEIPYMSELSNWVTFYTPSGKWLLRFSCLEINCLMTRTFLTRSVRTREI